MYLILNRVLLVKKLQFQKLAEQNKTLKGDFSLADLERVQDLAINDGETGNYLLKFDLDDSGDIVLEGNITVGVGLICQRCSEAYVENLNITIDDFSSDDFEQDVGLYEFIEDEILLSLPLIPRHAIEDCNVQPSSSIIDDAVEDDDGKDEKANPFGVLKKLIK